MGITGLLPFLEASSRKCYINEFRGCTVAIDSYCWLHKGTFACAEKLFRGEQTTAYVSYCLKYIQLLQSFQITPIMVFDGQHLPAKKGTEVRRREQRKFARVKGLELMRLGKIDKARQYFRQCVDVTHEMALALIHECRKKNVDCIVAPYEADAQLAYLNIQGIADIVITEDSDLILFGCSKIFFKFSLDGSGILVEKHNLNKSMRMRPDQYSFEKFRYMCILSGCDYLDSLPGIGIVRAHKAISMTHDANIYNLLPRLPRYLNLSKLIVSQEYIEEFKIADATIKHQIVYDPIKRKLIPLTDSSDADPEYLRDAGEISDSATAFQMALGNIDPISKKVVDNWNPDTDETILNSSIWSREYKKPKLQPKPENASIFWGRSTKNIEAKMSTEGLVTKTQQQGNISDYDEKLNEELKFYKDLGPEKKRAKTEECGKKIVVKAQVHSYNPFLKTKFNRFQPSADHDEIVRSRFFSSSSTKTEVECCSLNMETEQKAQYGNDDYVKCVREKSRTSSSMTQITTESSDECSFVRNALDKITVCDKDDVMDEDVAESDPISPVLSRTKDRVSRSLNEFKIAKARKVLKHENTLIEKITLCDEIDSPHSSLKESDGDSSDVAVQPVSEQASSEGLLSNIQFIQKKPLPKVGLSRNVKKSNQQTLISMFQHINKK